MHPNEPAVLQILPKEILVHGRHSKTGNIMVKVLGNNPKLLNWKKRKSMQKKKKKNCVKVQLNSMSVAKFELKVKNMNDDLTKRCVLRT